MDLNKKEERTNKKGSCRQRSLERLVNYVSQTRWTAEHIKARFFFHRALVVVLFQTMTVCICIYIYIYMPSGPQVSARGGVGCGMLTSCSWYVDGWGGVGHVNVIFMLRWWVGWGGVGWGMLTSFSWYVDGWGGAGHVNVIFMVRWCVGWGGAC